MHWKTLRKYTKLSCLTAIASNRIINSRVSAWNCFIKRILMVYWKWALFTLNFLKVLTSELHIYNTFQLSIMLTWANRRSSSSAEGRVQSRNISGTSVMVISRTRNRLTERSKQVEHTFSCRVSTKFLSGRSAACWIWWEINENMKRHNRKAWTVRKEKYEPAETGLYVLLA